MAAVYVAIRAAAFHAVLINSIISAFPSYAGKAAAEASRLNSRPLHGLRKKMLPPPPIPVLNRGTMVTESQAARVFRQLHGVRRQSLRRAPAMVRAPVVVPRLCVPRDLPLRPATAL